MASIPSRVLFCPHVFCLATVPCNHAILRAKQQAVVRYVRVERRACTRVPGLWQARKGGGRQSAMDQSPWRLG